MSNGHEITNLEILNPGRRYLQFLNNGCHLGVVGHLAVAIAVLLHAVDAQAGDVAAEHA